MTPALIRFAFDPVLHLGDGASVRLETVALAVVLLAALLVAARIASITPTDAPYVPVPMLRMDDLLLVVLGAVPGAVIGGRIGYALLHTDFYLAHPAALVDPAQGSLSLTLGLVGGVATGAVVARMVGAPVGRWMHAAALPLLFAIAAGKLVGILGADGQGAPTDLPWATAYAGPGPWASLGPEIPSHPSQVYEAIAAVLAILVLAIGHRAGAFRRRDGSALLVAIVAWAIGRAGVVLTWRDAPVAGPLRAEHLVLAAVVLLALVGIVRLRSRLASPTARGLRHDVEWPDPESRPTF